MLAESTVEAEGCRVGEMDTEAEAEEPLLALEDSVVPTEGLRATEPLPLRELLGV